MTMISRLGKTTPFKRYIAPASYNAFKALLGESPDVTKVREGGGLYVAELDPEKWSAGKPLGSPNDLFESASETDRNLKSKCHFRMTLISPLRSKRASFAWSGRSTPLSRNSSVKSSLVM